MNVADLILLAREVVDAAKRKGFDIDFMRHEGLFSFGDRYISFTQYGSQIKYSFSGVTKQIPRKLPPMSPIQIMPTDRIAFRGFWAESGIVENIDSAANLVIAYLLNNKEIEELPDRIVQSWRV